VEEAAAAAGALEEQAGRLQSAVATFRLAAEDARADRFERLPVASAVAGKVPRAGGAVRAMAAGKPAAKAPAPRAAAPVTSDEAARDAAEPAPEQPARPAGARTPRPALAAADNGDWSAF
jgi:methyl-accepting chemotaxis protein